MLWYKTSFALSFHRLSLSTLPTRHLIIGGSRAGGQGWAGAAPAKLTDKLIGTYMHSHTRAGETEGRTDGRTEGGRGEQPLSISSGKSATLPDRLDVGGLRFSFFVSLHFFTRMLLEAIRTSKVIIGN